MKSEISGIHFQKGVKESENKCMARGAHYLNRGFGDEQYGFFCNPTKQVISRLASTIHTTKWAYIVLQGGLLLIGDI